LTTYPFLLTGLTLLSVSLGFLGIAWCRCERRPARARWGRRVFLGVLGLVGLVSGAAAWEPHRGLLFLGLGVSALVIGMLWERPRMSTLPAEVRTRLAGE
jgi:hypothetical protein